jgi:hypothetical protein
VVRSLICWRKRDKLQILEGRKKQLRIVGLNEKVDQSVDEILNLIQ